MRDKIIYGIVLFVVLVFGSVSLFKMKSKQLPPADKFIFVQTATLEVFAQPVSLILPGTADKIQATNKQEIPEGTTVATGETGRAQLLFPNKSVTRMDFNTELILKKLTANPAQVEVKLIKKRIWNRVAKLLGKQDSFQTETGITVATVRGTSYAHGILPDGRNRIIATKGTVETKCLDNSQNATVTPNAKILFNCKGGGNLPLLQLDEEVKDRDEWFEFNQKEDSSLDVRFGKDTYGDE